MSIIYNITDNIIDSIKPYIKDKSDDDFEIAKYGLNLFLMDLYKLPIIFGLAYCFGIFKYCFLSYILLGILRSRASGLHMKSGKGCLLYSTLAFFCVVYVSKILVLHWIFRVFISLIAMYVIYKYAPADTEQKPILNPNTRKRNNIISICLGIIYILISFVLKDKVISNILLLVLILQCVMVHPITYKIFKRRYNNYEYFK